MNLEDKRYQLTKHRIECMHELGLQTAMDVLTYYPYRYEVMQETPISTWQFKDKVTFEARLISNVKVFRFGYHKSGANFDVMSQDHVLHITIFNRPWARSLKVDDIITITGIYQGNGKVTATTYVSKPIDQIDSITPIYSTKANIMQKTIRGSIEKVMQASVDELRDIVPIEFMRKYKLLHRKDAMYKVHFPTSLEDVKQGYRTLKYEEFLRFFLALEILNNQNSYDAYKTPKKFDRSAIASYIASLPYALTKDQQSAIDEILDDLSSTNVMNRLLQGDVGCGKTVVGTVCLYACALSNMQSALLAPTEILAKQHYEGIKQALEPLGVQVAFLSSGLSKAEKNEVYEGLANGSISIVIGTHALIEDAVVFKNLGLVIADEQQRFGVNQRKKLFEKGECVDVLLMSATPIPRTLASALYGDIAITSIHTMPKGRKKVITKVILENSFRSVKDEVDALLKSGRQMYVICAAVNDNEGFHARNVKTMKENLSKYFAPYVVDMLHGQMSSDEKNAVMQAFYNNEVQILVSTTVVEVGMNVVNATGMVIYDSERFGLSQLHQLRGRVQRGSHEGVCYLLTDSKEIDALNRLKVLETTSDGFKIASEDLRFRGPGDILGTRQSGIPDLVLGNLIEDTNMIETARKDAVLIMEDKDHSDYQTMYDYVLAYIKRK